MLALKSVLVDLHAVLYPEELLSKSVTYIFVDGDAVRQLPSALELQIVMGI